MQQRDTVIIGGGLAGLVAAYELARDGRKPVVVEASGQVGGYLAPVRLLPVPANASAESAVLEPPFPALTVDAGAESFATRNREVSDFIAGLGLEIQRPLTAPAWCFPAQGKQFELPAAGILGIPSDAAAHGLDQALSEEAIALVAAESQLPADAVDRENLAAFVSSRLGTAVLERLVRPITGGVHSTDPELLDATVVHPRIWELYAEHGSLTQALRHIRTSSPAGSAVSGIVGGMHQLPLTLSQKTLALGGSILTHTSATSLKQTDAGWRVTVCEEGRGSSEILAQSVVLAVPVKTAVQLLGSASAVAEQDVRNVERGTDIAIVTIVSRVAHLADRGTGALIAPGSQISAKGSTHVSRKWPWVQELLTRSGYPEDAHVFRFSYGRHGEPAVGPDADLLRLALQDLELVYEAAGLQVLCQSVSRWPNALAPNSPQLRSVRSQFMNALGHLKNIYVTGSWISGTGIAAIIPHAVGVAKELSDKPSFNNVEFEPK